MTTPVTTRCLTAAYRNAPHHCVKCQQPRAHWAVKHEMYGAEMSPLCALCFFETSGWLETHRQQFTLVVNAIGLRRNRGLECEASGRLVHLKDADDVLGAIVLHDRFDSVQRLKTTLQGGLG